MDDSKRTLTDNEQALLDFEILGNTLKGEISDAADSFSNCDDGIAAESVFRGNKHDAQAFLKTLSIERIGQLIDVIQCLIIWVHPCDELDPEDFVESLKLNELAFWPDTSRPTTRALINSIWLQKLCSGCKHQFNSDSFHPCSSIAEEELLKSKLRAAHAERFLSSVNDSQLDETIQLLNRLVGFRNISPNQARNEPAEFLKQVQMSHNLCNPFVEGLVDLHRLATAMMTHRNQAVAIIKVFHSNRLPYIWGWFQRCNLPLSTPDCWFESLELFFPNVDDDTFGIDGDVANKTPAWCDSYRHDLISFVLCDEPPVILSMLEAVILVATSLLHSVHPRESFCERYHDVLELRIHCERRGSPLGLMPNLWERVGGLLPIPESTGWDDLAGVSNLVQNAFANAFDALLFDEIESQIWDERIELTRLIDCDSSESNPSFNRRGNMSACESRFDQWSNLLYTVEVWFLKLLAEAKFEAGNCSEIPRMWEDVLCDGSASERVTWSERPILPNGDEVLSWTDFAKSIRPLFTLPDKPLRTLRDFMSWLDQRFTTLRNGKVTDLSMPWRIEPPVTELRRILGAQTLRNAHCWLEWFELSGWPGEGLEIPAEIFQQERSLIQLLKWVKAREQYKLQRRNLTGKEADPQISSAEIEVQVNSENRPITEVPVQTETALEAQAWERVEREILGLPTRKQRSLFELLWKNRNLSVKWSEVCNAYAGSKTDRAVQQGLKGLRDNCGRSKLAIVDITVPSTFDHLTTVTMTVTLRPQNRAEK